MSNVIGKRIKEAMVLRGLKQVDIVKKTGINKGALSSYISGKYLPKQTNIYKLAKVLDVSPVWLMGYDVDMNNTTMVENDLVIVEKNVGEFKIGQKIGGNDILEYIQDLIFSVSKKGKDSFNVYISFLCVLKQLYKENKLTKEQYDIQKNQYIDNLLKKKYIDDEQYDFLKQKFD